VTSTWTRLITPERFKLNVDLTQFLAAIIDVQGGEVRIPYSFFAEEHPDKVMMIDLEDDGATIVLRLRDASEVNLDDSDGTADV